MDLQQEEGFPVSDPISEFIARLAKAVAEELHPRIGREITQALHREPVAAENLDSQQAADYLRLRKSTLDGWRSRGTGPAFVKMGRRVIYERSALAAFVAARSHQKLKGGAS